MSLWCQRPYLSISIFHIRWNSIRSVLFQVAVLLRNSLLVSSMLNNTEAWYNITRAELELLETIDVHFLRSILKAPKSTPREMLFLELGCIPFRHLIMKRRILFLHYILNEKKTTMLYKFLMAQIRNKTKKVGPIIKTLAGT